ncbi:LysR family transcriptional regulator [Acinetobacter gerneri]|uniref:LysR family transcriptional regulator n=1 Tax=Acinetobacter gerneri TaxID=202952 RepID=UPI0028A7226E|nr:LysR family transcriptional regulator [Acinetobacter gerneri]
MTFTQLEIFTLIAEYKSFTTTANRLGISQSAVSHALKSLEKHWSVSLISRSQGDIELTETGKKLLVHVKELLSISNTLQQEISAVHGLYEGTLRIGSFGASSSIVLLPLILDAFQKKYPKIDVYIDEGDDNEIPQWILERKIDVGFIIAPDERFDIFPLLEDIFIALVPSSYPIAEKKSIPIQDLADYPFLMTTAGSQKYVKQLLNRFGVKPTIKCHFSQMLTIISMVEKQNGISIVADMALNHELLTLYPHVVKRPLEPNTTRKIGLAVKNKKHLSPAAKAFIEVAQSVLSKA